MKITEFGASDIETVFEIQQAAFEVASKEITLNVNSYANEKY